MAGNIEIDDMTDRLLKLSDVMAKTSVGRTWIYEHIRSGEFPAPVRLGEQCVRWRESEIDDWIASREKAA